MTLTLPDDPALAEFDEDALRLDLACALFAAGRVSRSVAARIAGMSQLAFDEETFQRHLSNYTETVLNEDLATLSALSKQ